MTRALFVEGPSEHLHDGHSFVRLWQEAILGNLGLPRFDHICAINKKFLIAMRPGSPKMSGASLPLDHLIEQKRKELGFDCAVVAWDLVPGWAGGVAHLCRWEETVEFYEGIARSRALPNSWTAFAAARVQDLTNRTVPSERAALTKLAPNSIMALCMEDMFESLIACDERMVKNLLGCHGKEVNGWPKKWKRPPKRVDTALLSPAIAAARRLRPRVVEAFAVQGDMITAKHEWGYFFVQRMLSEAGSRKARDHQICKRLREVL